jgi:hypothetical protein
MTQNRMAQPVSGRHHKERQELARNWRSGMKRIKAQHPKTHITCKQRHEED